jgi:hypothetical protein
MATLKMSALGHKGTLGLAPVISALPPKADIADEHTEITDGLRDSSDDRSRFVHNREDSADLEVPILF